MIRLSFAIPNHIAKKVFIVYTGVANNLHGGRNRDKC